MQCLSCPASKHYRHKPFGSHAVRQGLASCSEGLKNLRFWHMKSPRSWKDCPGFIERCGTPLLCQSSKLSPTSAHSDTSQNLSVRQLFSRPDMQTCLSAGCVRFGACDNPRLQTTTGPWHLPRPCQPQIPRRIAPHLCRSAMAISGGALRTWRMRASAWAGSRSFRTACAHYQPGVDLISREPLLSLSS